jgi:hypothetical protein
MATLDHHDPEYIGIEDNYDGTDYNDYIFEASLD